MEAVHNYDKNDPKTWPDKEKDGDFVLCKIDAKKFCRNGLYQYEVMSTKATDNCDLLVAWMRIPKNLQRFGLPPVKEIPGNPNPIMGDIGVLNNETYIYDGDTWLYYRDLEEWETQSKTVQPGKLDKALSDMEKSDDLKKLQQEIRKEVKELRNIIATGPDSTDKCVCIEGWLVIVIFALGLFFGLFIRVNLVV